MVFKPSNYLEYCNGECFSPPDEIIHSGFQIRWLCVSSSECMLCRANAVLLVKWNGHWGPASPLILRAFWPCCLGMNSERLLDVSQLGLESMQAQLWASALGANSRKQACGRSMLLLVTRMLTAPPPFTTAFDSLRMYFFWPAVSAWFLERPLDSSLAWIQNSPLVWN